MTFTKQANEIFNQAIADYHLKDNTDTPINNPYKRDCIEYQLYTKCWIDTVQWHLEDIIRDPAIDPAAALQLKRRIDRSNQDRTDLVEEIDSHFRNVYSNVSVLPEARLNTESLILKSRKRHLKMGCSTAGCQEPGMEDALRS